MNYLSVSLGPNGVALANRLFKDSGFDKFLIDPNVELVNSWTFLPCDQWNHPVPASTCGLWSKFPRSFSEQEIVSCTKLVAGYFCEQCGDDTVALFQHAPHPEPVATHPPLRDGQTSLLPARSLNKEHVSYLVALGSVSDRPGGILAKVDSVESARVNIEQGRTQVIRDMHHFITAYDDGTIVISGTHGPSPVLFSFGEP
jgi:hypothetical protein